MSDAQRINASEKGPPILFGDPEDFAIRYVPGHGSDGFHYAWLHLVIRGRPIGDVSENCIATTWLIGIRNVLERVEAASELLVHPEFIDRDNEELFALVWKANGNQDPGYSHLPTLPNTVWTNCHIAIDETTDSYLIAMIRVGQRLRFLWQEMPLPSTLYSHTTDPATVIRVLRLVLEHVQARLGKML